MADPPKKSHPLEFPKDDEDAAGNGDAEQPAGDDKQPQVTQHVDEQQIKQFITPLKSFEQQVGEHVMRALQSEDTVAVITAVVTGSDGQQRVVSAALDPNLMTQVQQLLGDAAQQREEEVPCLGFHCYTRRKEEGGKSTDRQVHKSTKKKRGRKTKRKR